MGLNVWQLLLVLVIVLLLFGRGRIPGIMSDLASGIKSFKQGIKDEEEKKPSPQTTQSIDSTSTAPSEREHV